MKKHNKSKLNNKKGFSLTEMLVTVLILALATAVVATGIPAAMRTYNGITSKANGQMLLSTSLSEIRAKLGTATNVALDSSNTKISFTCSDDGRTLVIFPSDDGLKIGENESSAILIVSKESASKGICSWTAGSVSLSSGIVSIDNITVKVGDNTIASLDKFTVRTGDCVE